MSAKEQKVGVESRDEKADYQSVDEGLTTDTTDYATEG